MKHKVRNEIIYLFLKILSFLILLLPLGLSTKIGAFLGYLAYLILPKYRRIALENLKSAFGREKTEKELQRICRVVFENLGKNLGELLNFPKINKQNIDRFISVSGLEKVDALFAEGRGVVVVSAHLGNWELLPVYFALKGYAINVIARRMRFPKYNEWVNRIRLAKNVRVIWRDGSFKELLTILKSNQILGILPDQDIDSVEGVFVDFFGRKAYTPTGPVSLALVSKAALVTCYIYRHNNHHHIVIEDPITLSISEDKEKTLTLNTQKWQERLESYIRLHPEQWVWMHRRWKTKNA